MEENNIIEKINKVTCELSYKDKLDNYFIEYDKSSKRCSINIWSSSLDSAIAFLNNVRNTFIKLLEKKDEN